MRGLGLTCDITTAARILGIGRTTAFDLLRRGSFPVEVIALGRVRRVRTADLLAYLRVPAPGQAPADGVVPAHDMPGRAIGAAPRPGGPEPDAAA